jgi:D-alanyl-lipoteichoic acid acyltransferase DltB (MBOAT superfamily)
VIADNCAEYVNSIFANYESFGGSTLALGVFLFAFQIYCDFSGYSDIALGSARLLGIDLLRNFAFPYFSRDIAEFWRRWHISLTTWFRDYLYIPLGGNRGPAWKKIRLAFLVFLVSGFWHGANWTFIAWGLLNALFFIPLYILNINRTHLEIVAKGKLFPSIKEFLAICTTFCMVTLAWIFFRAESVRQAFDYIKRMFSASLFKAPDTQAFVQSKINIVLMLLLIAFLLVTEWLGRENHYALAGFGASWKRPARWAAYSILLATVFLFMGKEQQFIYFQF